MRECLQVQGAERFRITRINGRLVLNIRTLESSREFPGRNTCCLLRQLCDWSADILNFPDFE